MDFKKNNTKKKNVKFSDVDYLSKRLEEEKPLSGVA